MFDFCRVAYPKGVELYEVLDNPGARTSQDHRAPAHETLPFLITPCPILTGVLANCHHLASRADSSSKLRGNVLPVCFSILKVGASAM